MILDQLHAPRTRVWLSAGEILPSRGALSGWGAQSWHYLAARNDAKAFNVPRRVKPNEVYYGPNMFLNVLHTLTI